MAHGTKGGRMEEAMSFGTKARVGVRVASSQAYPTPKRWWSTGNGRPQSRGARGRPPPSRGDIQTWRARSVTARGMGRPWPPRRRAACAGEGCAAGLAVSRASVDGFGCSGKCGGVVVRSRKRRNRERWARASMEGVVCLSNHGGDASGGRTAHHQLALVRP